MTESQTPPPSSPPPHGVRLWTILIVLAIAVLAMAAGAFWGQPRGLKNLLHWRPDATTQAAAQSNQWYTCGMHPWVVLHEPGNCPICQMPLVPLDPAKFTGQVAIDPVILQNIGVRITNVTSGPVTRSLRTVGNVDYDETALRDINTKFAGWIDKLYVNYSGEKVKKGQPLFDIYSPELYNAQQDYLLALGEDDRQNLQAVRQRLEYFDISDEQIKTLEKTRQLTKTLTITSPFDGTVTVKTAVEGMRVEAGTQLYRIADLSKVWVMAVLYEYQLPYVQVGQQAVMSLPYIPGQTFEGKVTYIYPYLNAELRQVKVRLEFPNPNLILKPGMYANVEIRSTLAKDRLLVPREAVIDTGERQIAFVSLGKGRFEPRIVKVGVEAQNGMLEILDGLKKDDPVVTSGQFLLDSESRLREDLAKMIKGTPAAEQQTAAAPASQPAEGMLSGLSEPVANELTTAIKSYLALGSALSQDKVPPAAAARELAGSIDKLIAIPIAGQEQFWRQHDEAAVIRGKALELIEAKEIAPAREKFADLSTAMDKLLKATGVPAAVGKEIQELHCPMYREGQGGSMWLQEAGEVRNPFYGASMLGCFDRKASLPAAGNLATTQPK